MESELLQAGWARIRSRPENGKQILVAREWIDRRSGQSDQFLTSSGIYNAATDTVDLQCMDEVVRTVPAKSLHWWMEISDPTTYRLLEIAAAKWFRGCSSGSFLY